MKKKILSILLVGAMTISMLVGCGGSSSDDTSDSSSTTSSEESEPVTLTVLWGQSTTDAGVEDMIDAALAEAYPNVTIEWECVDWGEEFGPKMQQYLQSGLPDIMIGKAQDVATYQALGILGEIDDEYVSRGLDAAAENVTIDGTTYGMVINALYQGVYYNKTLFAEQGWEVPNTIDELNDIIAACEDLGIEPFASHMVDTWSIGNVTMQFMMNEVFNNTADWGDQFRAGDVSFATDEAAQTAYLYNQLIYENTFDNTFSTEQTECDAKMVTGEAAMKVSGSWSIQNFLAIDEEFDFGIFPFPNSTGDAKLIFEPNITVMTNGDSDKQDAINAFLDVITGDEDLLVELLDYTMTASMIDGVTPTFANPSQEDIDAYAADGRIVDVTLGNTQLVWSGFQEENAADIAAWLQGDITFEECLEASDARVGTSTTE